MVEEWMPSADAIEVVALRYDASKMYFDYEVARRVAEDALLKRLANGALQARAAKGLMNSGDPFGMENESNFENECLPAAFWWALSVCEPQGRSLDWVLGDFSYSSGYGEHSASGSAFDVHFDMNSIPGASRLAETMAASKAEKDRPGRPAKYDWPKTVLAIFGLIFRGDLKPENQAEIERAILAHLSDENGGPSQSTVRPYAKLIWEEYDKVWNCWPIYCRPHFGLSVRHCTAIRG